MMDSLDVILDLVLGRRKPKLIWMRHICQNKFYWEDDLPGSKGATGRYRTRSDERQEG